MQSSLVQEEPQNDAADRIWKRTVYADPVEHHQQHHHRDAQDQINRADLAAVEQRDNDNCHDIVDDDSRGKEHAQLNRDTIAKQHDQSDCEGSIGTDWNPPPVPQVGRRNQGVDQRWQDYATKCGDHR